MGMGYRVVGRADRKEAEIYIYEDVGESFFGGVSAVQFRDDLKALGDVSRIALRLNSPGGDVFEGLAIYRMLAEHRATITAHIDGIAASIASIIAMSAKEIVIAEAGFLMIHNASGGVHGGAEDMRSMADTLDAITGSLVGIYKARTKAGDDQLKTWMDGETWFTGAEAVEHGFADKIAPNVSVSACLTAEVRTLHGFRHAPARLIRHAAPRPAFDAAYARARRQAAALARGRR